MDNIVNEFIIESSAANIQEELDKCLARSGMHWEAVVAAYNDELGTFTESYTLAALIESGEITIKEYAILLKVMNAKPLFAVAPLHINSVTDAANRWANS